MSTNSTIAIELPSGRILGVYCHWDGYIDHNGAILASCFNNKSLALQLISGGHISAIEVSGDVEYYRYSLRFKGSDNATMNPFHVADNYNEFLSRYAREYNYLFKNNFWNIIKK